MKIAVFGKPDGGKSTVAEQIAQKTGLPLIQLDLIQYTSGGRRVSDEEFVGRHRELFAQSEWVIDGFATPQTIEAMLTTAHCRAGPLFL